MHLDWKGLLGKSRGVPHPLTIRPDILHEGASEDYMEHLGLLEACRRNTFSGTVKLLSLKHSILLQKMRDLLQKM